MQQLQFLNNSSIFDVYWSNSWYCWNLWKKTFPPISSWAKQLNTFKPVQEDFVSDSDDGEELLRGSSPQLGEKKTATQTGNLEQTKNWKTWRHGILEVFVSRWGVYSEYSTRILLGLSSTVSKRKLWVAQHISTALRAEITVRENEKCHGCGFDICVLLFTLNLLVRGK